MTFLPADDDLADLAVRARRCPRRPRPGPLVTRDCRLQEVDASHQLRRALQPALVLLHQHGAQGRSLVRPYPCKKMGPNLAMQPPREHLLGHGGAGVGEVLDAGEVVLVLRRGSPEARRRESGTMLMWVTFSLLGGCQDLSELKRGRMTALAPGRMVQEHRPPGGVEDGQDLRGWSSAGSTHHQLASPMPTAVVM